MLFRSKVSRSPVVQTDNFNPSRKGLISREDGLPLWSDLLAVDMRMVGIEFLQTSKTARMQQQSVGEIHEELSQDKQMTVVMPKIETVVLADRRMRSHQYVMEVLREDLFVGMSLVFPISKGGHSVGSLTLEGR